MPESKHAFHTPINSTLSFAGVPPPFPADVHLHLACQIICNWIINFRATMMKSFPTEYIRRILLVFFIILSNIPSASDFWSEKL
jgi:hypothetical protein